ncbi:hypothetical protein L204_102507 [Cryptococcus depauperatus]|nr:hypothetical protein L204_00747 [Cryptococcus depauperatus CBS 7855]
MLAPQQRPKRPRSPSPSFEPEVASPLDLFLKRRRREQRKLFEHSSPIHSIDQECLEQHAKFGSEVDAESSHSAQWRDMAMDKGIEKRRARQWDKINAPLHAAVHHQQSHPQHNSLATPGPTPPVTRSISISALPKHNSHTMSSSPIRNQPPSSSPFREKLETRRDTEWMVDQDEMRREWGEVYSEQNSLLYSLHLARIQSQPHITSPPSRPSNHSRPSYPSHAYRTPLASSSTAFSPHRHQSTSSSPYASQCIASSSPFTPACPSLSYPPSHSGIIGGQDEEMLVEKDEQQLKAEEHVRRRYEETNRLLGELAMVREQRWGACEEKV